MWGTSGNLSVRVQEDPLAFLVTASGRDKGALAEEDMLLVGADGQPLEDWKGRPSAEMPVHERIYRRYDAGAVYHVHTVMAAVISDCFAERGGLALEGVEMLKGFGHPVPEISLLLPIVDNHADSNVIAHNLERGAQPGVPGVLIRNHGLYAWGRTAAETRNHVEVFEYLFSYAYHRATLRAALR
jgi:methylthioribulose-1-phosphate dehydratase